MDENTSFRKRREDVTLADVKVGEFISAQGALHEDSFLATSLRIMPPSVTSGANSGVNGPGHLLGAPPAAPVQ